MRFFFADGGERTVAGAEDGVVGKREDFLPVGLEGFGKGDLRTSDRAGEKGVPDNGDGPVEALDDVGGAPRAVPAGEGTANAELAGGENLTLGEWSGALEMLLLWAEDLGFTGFPAKALEVGDVIAVGMGEEDEIQLEFFIPDEIDHGGGIGPGIEGDGLVCSGIPNEVGVDIHDALVVGGKAPKTGDAPGFGPPRLPGQLDEGFGVQFEGGGDRAQGLLLGGALQGIVDLRGFKPGLACELVCIDSATGDGLGNDIFGAVFERNDHKGRRRKIIGTRSCW